MEMPVNACILKMKPSSKIVLIEWYVIFIPGTVLNNVTAYQWIGKWMYAVTNLTAS